MKTRLAILPLLAVSLLMVGCGSLKRAGKDVAVVATSPVTIPLSATYDSLDWGDESSTWTSAMFFPANFVLHGLKHVGYTAAHLGDVVIAPMYLLGSIDPDNDLKPLGLYTLDEGYPWKSYAVPSFETR